MMAIAQTGRVAELKKPFGQFHLRGLTSVLYTFLANTLQQTLNQLALVPTDASRAFLPSQLPLRSTAIIPLSPRPICK